MGMRVHTGQASVVALSLLEPQELVDVYGDSFAGLGQGLAVEDTANCEALILLGDDDEIAQFALDILKLLGREP